MDPARVREVWQAVSYWIASALDHGGGLTDFAMIEHAVLNGTNLLWLVWDGREILAAGITSLATANPRSERGQAARNSAPSSRSAAVTPDRRRGQAPTAGRCSSTGSSNSPWMKAATAW